MGDISTLERLFRYKAQSNREIMEAMRLFDNDSPQREIAIRVIHHTYIVDRIFAAHLTGSGHGYTSANMEEAPTLEDLSMALTQSDQWYIDHVARLDQPQLTQMIDFTFTDGALGRMSREEMLMHLSIHGAAHRGQVAWIMMQNAITPAADGLTTYLHRTEGPARRRSAGEAESRMGGRPPADEASTVPWPAMSPMAEMTERVRLAVEGDGGIGRTLKLDLKGEGFIHIDGASVTNEDLPAELTLTASIDDLRALGQGRLTPMSAIVSGRLRVSNMGVAAGVQGRLQTLFTRMSRAAPPSPAV